MAYGVYVCVPLWRKDMISFGFFFFLTEKKKNQWNRAIHPGLFLLIKILLFFVNFQILKFSSQPFFAVIEYSGYLTKGTFLILMSILSS